MNEKEKKRKRKIKIFFASAAVFVLGVVGYQINKSPDHDLNSGKVTVVVPDTPNKDVEDTHEGDMTTTTTTEEAEDFVIDQVTESADSIIGDISSVVDVVDDKNITGKDQETSQGQVAVNPTTPSKPSTPSKPTKPSEPDTPVKPEIHVHVYSDLLNYDDDVEYIKCNGCDLIITRAHKLGDKVYDKENQELVEKCENPDCTYEIRTTHKYHQTLNFKSASDKGEEYECDECGEIITKAHTYGEVHYDKVTHEAIQDCENEECGYEHRELHKDHVSTTFKSADKEKEIWECDDCGAEIDKDHVYGAVHYDKVTHEEIKDCENEDCGYEHRELHQNHTKATLQSHTSEKETWKCDDCDAEFDKTHVYGNVHYDKGTHEEIKTCETPGCGEEVRTEHQNHVNATFKSNDNLKETWECDDCGAEFEKSHVVGAVEIEEGTFDWVQKCETPGCTYEIRDPHENHHNYKIASNDETHEHWECEDCHDTFEKEHVFNEGVEQPDGTLLQSCQNDGCDYQRYWHNHVVGNEEKVFYKHDGIYDEKKCYTIIYKCRICNEEVRRVDYNHDFEEYAEFGIKVCKNAGCGYEVEYEPINEVNGVKITQAPAAAFDTTRLTTETYEAPTLEVFEKEEEKGKVLSLLPTKKEEF